MESTEEIRERLSKLLNMVADVRDAAQKAVAEINAMQHQLDKAELEKIKAKRQ